MKRINIDKLEALYLSKPIVIIGMLLTVFSLYLAVLSILPDKNYDPVNDDVSRQFEFWVYSYMTAIPSLLLYIIDGVFCIIRVFFKLDSTFNLVLGVLIFAMIPMIIFIGSWYPGSIIWNVYYFAVFVLEIISIIRTIKQRKTLIY